jgi:molybdopterin-guanine dinucleotide biosynthesis protein A
MPSAAILAGGRATRFGGQPKGDLLVAGRSILARQLDELSQITSDILIVGGAPDVVSRVSGVRHVADRFEGCGPLAGLDAALASARDDTVAIVACDMPFVSAAFLRHLLGLMSGVDAVVPRTTIGLHPLCGIYTRTCQMAVARRLAGRRLAMAGLLDEIRVRVVEPHELSAFDCDQLLANLNTPDEFASVLSERASLPGRNP